MIKSPEHTTNAKMKTMSGLGVEGVFGSGLLFTARFLQPYEIITSYNVPLASVLGMVSRMKCTDFIMMNHMQNSPIHINNEQNKNMNCTLIEALMCAKT